MGQPEKLDKDALAQRKFRIAESLKKLRGDRSKVAIYTAAGISRATYDRLEDGQGNPELSVLNRLAVYFDVPIARILGEQP